MKMAEFIVSGIRMAVVPTQVYLQKSEDEPLILAFGPGDHDYGILDCTYEEAVEILNEALRTEWPACHCHD